LCIRAKAPLSAAEAAPPTTAVDRYSLCNRVRVSWMRITRSMIYHRARLTAVSPLLLTGGCRRQIVETASVRLLHYGWHRRVICQQWRRCGTTSRSKRVSRWKSSGRAAHTLPSAAGDCESWWERTRGRLLRPPRGGSETQVFPAAPDSDNPTNTHVRLRERLCWRFARDDRS